MWSGAFLPVVSTGMGVAMAARGTALAELVVSDNEREILERWARRPTTAQALALRCRIVLACAEGLSNVEVADRLGVNRMTVGKLHSRFVSDRLDVGPVGKFGRCIRTPRPASVSSRRHGRRPPGSV